MIRISLPILGCVALLLLLGSTTVLLQPRNSALYQHLYFTVREDRYMQLHAPALHLLSLNYTGFAADVQWLRLIQYIGGTVHSGAYKEHLATALTTITTLDPEFLEPSLLGLLLLSGDDPDTARMLGQTAITQHCHPEGVQLLMEHSFTHLPTVPFTDICDGVPLLPSLMGLLHATAYEDYPMAARYYLMAAHTAGSPPEAMRLPALMLSNAGERELTLALWAQLYEEAPSEQFATYALQRLLREERLQLLERAYADYLKQEGRTPSTPQTLIDAQYLPPEVLLDPLTTPTVTYHYIFEDSGRAKAVVAPIVQE